MTVIEYIVTSLQEARSEQTRLSSHCVKDARTEGRIKALEGLSRAYEVEDKISFEDTVEKNMKVYREFCKADDLSQEKTEYLEGYGSELSAVKTMIDNQERGFAREEWAQSFGFFDELDAALYMRR